MDQDYVPQPSTGGTLEGGAVNKKQKGRLSVERIYQKKTQLEHILLRPDTYIGSVQPVTEKMWVFDEDTKTIVNREITYVPGFYKIFDEILVNAADNKQRDKKMDTIKIDIKPEENMIRIYNNGKGIPVEMHKEQNMYVPTMIFGHLLTSSNFDDEEEKVTGGRNGFGAKLCNVFSTKFTVETGSKDSKKEFKQSWGSNMSKASEPRIKTLDNEEFTRVTYFPDLAKFQMTSLDKDTVSLLSRRAYDIAATTGGVKVYLNGTKIPVKGFKDYVENFYLKDKEDETGQPIKVQYEKSGERWEIAVAPSSDGFQQMSFVNSIATTKGGRHIEYVAKLISDMCIDSIKRKNKSGIQIKPHQIKNHLWVFVNCLIVNPTFDSQTKENMTSQANTFGSKCTLSDKFKQGVIKSGIVESVLAYQQFKQDRQQKGQLTGKKTSKIKGVTKLDDANQAGTKNSLDCTLVLTEGDSAKTMAVAGVSAVERGKDYFGVYPLKGKLLNVREASHKQIMENKEINELVKIVGLQRGKKYATVDDMKSLRYGKVMIMTDQDQDGSHIKGLLINLIHYYCPTLVKLPFLEEFITPIVKVQKGEGERKREMSFFSIPEFTEWKNKTENWNQWKIKYYKGLGTSTNKEAKEYFSDMVRHRIKFSYQGEADDNAVNLAFSKKMIEERKDWLMEWMEECRRRKNLGLPEVYLYEKDTRSVSYADFVNKELVLFSNADNERSIPSMVDGLKPGQRKVMFTCIKRNDKKEVKVAQLAGSVSEKSAYHHGEASLMGTIVHLAQDYVGSNNINLLEPRGQFGSRLKGGGDSASPRYICTMMSPITRHIFNPKDDAILKYLQDDNKWVEPEWYIPIIPMVLINGADGIGTGWMTKIPNYNPREIVEMILALLDGKTIDNLKPLVPWYKGFKGTIEPLDYQRYVCNGEISEISDTQIEITELPIKTWTEKYKAQVLEPMLGSEKVKAQISDYNNYSTNETIRFTVSMSKEEKCKQELEKGLHTFFKLQTTVTTSSMVLFDKHGCMKRYDEAGAIVQDFFDLRLEYYGKRKKHLEGLLGAEALKLSNQARFIIEKCDETLKVENKKRKKMIEELHRRNYDPDPVKAWKNSNTQQLEEYQSQDAAAENGDLDDDEKNQDKKDEEVKAAEYDYLLGMPMWNLTLEKKEEFLRKKEEKNQELRNLKATSKEDLWRADLKEFVKELDKVEQKQLEDQQVPKKGAKKKDAGRKKAAFLPSPDKGVRIVPKISDELKRKASAAVAAKDRKNSKSVFGKTSNGKMAECDEFDAMVDGKEHNRSLSDRLGVNLKAEEKSKKRKGVNNTKQATKDRKITNYFEPKPENVSTDDLSDVDDEMKSFDEDDKSPVEVKEKKVVRPKKLLTTTGSDDSDFGATVSKQAKSKNPNGKPPPAKKSKATHPKALPKKKSVFTDSSDESGSDSEFNMTGNGPEKGISQDLPARERPGRARKAAPTYNFDDSENESSEDFA